MWENTVITDAGTELVAGLLSGESITISAIRSGAGSVPVSDLKTQTAVTNIKQEATIQEIKKVDDYIEISALFTNTGLTAGYDMKQVGIYAKSGSSEILFAISQTETAKEIPSETEMPLYSLSQYFRFQFKNDVSMTAAALSSGGLCTMDLYEALQARVATLENLIQDCIAIKDES